MASLTNKYLDSTGLSALLVRIANLFNWLKNYTDDTVSGIDYSNYITKATYSSDSKTISFTNQDGTEVSSIDASDFLVDGMLQAVELTSSDEDGNEGKYLHFTFNTDAGADDIYVDVQDLVDTYIAGDGIDITDNVVSIVISSSSESYLTVSSDGLSINGIDTIKEQVETNTSDISSLNTWVDEQAITEDEIDSLITTVGADYEGFAEAMGVE